MAIIMTGVLISNYDSNRGQASYNFSYNLPWTSKWIFVGRPLGTKARTQVCFGALGASGHP